MSSIITDGWSYSWIAWRLRPWDWQWISAATATTAESGRINGHANRIASPAGPRAGESAMPAAWGRDAQPAGYQEFFGTQPPLFSRTEEPLDADAWLHTIDSKFALLAVPCADANKAHFAAQQLRGPARIWWDHYCAMQPAGHIISWEEFRNAFRSHHIADGLIERK